MMAFGFPLAAFVGLLAADPAGMYLPPSETGGSEYQFNPASVELRQAIKTEVRKDDLLDARALADDLVFLRRALRKQYVGYPELLQLPDFDVEGLFDEHVARLRSGAAKVKYADSALALFLELKRHIEDRHLALYGPGWNPVPRTTTPSTRPSSVARRLRSKGVPRRGAAPRRCGWRRFCPRAADPASW
jgi:hypothetical protein